MLLEKWIKTAATKDMPKLLIASYLLNDPSAFSDTTSTIIWSHAGPLDDYRKLRFPGCETCYMVGESRARDGLSGFLCPGANLAQLSWTPRELRFVCS
jgi:hypothetical protein